MSAGVGVVERDLRFRKGWDLGVKSLEEDETAEGGCDSGGEKLLMGGDRKRVKRSLTSARWSLTYSGEPTSSQSSSHPSFPSNPLPVSPFVPSRVTLTGEVPIGARTSPPSKGRTVNLIVLVGCCDLLILAGTRHWMNVLLILAHAIVRCCRADRSAISRIRPRE